MGEVEKCLRYVLVLWIEFSTSFLPSQSTFIIPFAWPLKKLMEGEEIRSEID